MLEVNHLTRQYGSFKAVDNVSFTIDKGEIVGLLGHNGAGKTTIMKMISGFLEPNQGSIRVDSVSLTEETKRVQMKLGYLPENLPIYPEMTVADYLDYAADLKGINNEVKKAEIKRVVVATDIAAKLLEPIATLSKGYKQRVGVAQAILGRPRLLILDEPTSGLDPEQTQHMRQLIRGIAEDATVILSTHIMQEVDALCSRVLILRTGQLAVDARLQELRRSNHLRLETTLPKARSLRGLEGIKNIEPMGRPDGDDPTDLFMYRIELDALSDPRTVSADLANKIADLEHALFLLQPEHRDLETLFREVNEGGDQPGGLSDAA